MAIRRPPLIGATTVKIRIDGEEIKTEPVSWTMRAASTIDTGLLDLAARAGIARHDGETDAHFRLRLEQFKSLDLPHIENIEKALMVQLIQTIKLIGEQKAKGVEFMAELRAL